jgi:hypothetical protein
MPRVASLCTGEFRGTSFCQSWNEVEEKREDIDKRLWKASHRQAIHRNQVMKGG